MAPEMKNMSTMDAKEYSDTLFGRVVDFETVAQDYAEYAKVFASGSPALEKSLLTLWDYGLQTFACGNGYDERLENFSLGVEQNIQSRYDTYLNSTGLQKILMKKEDYVPKYHGYISIDAATISDPKLFKKYIDRELKSIMKKKAYNVEQSHTNGTPSVTIYLAVERDKPSAYKEICLSAIEPEEALRITLPEKTTFDKYFEAITRGIENYSKSIGLKKGCLEQLNKTTNKEDAQPKAQVASEPQFFFIKMNDEIQAKLIYDAAVSKGINVTMPDKMHVNVSIQDAKLLADVIENYNQNKVSVENSLAKSDYDENNENDDYDGK